MKTSPSTAVGRFVVITDMKSGSAMAFDKVIDRIGQALKVTASVWLLRAEGTAGTVRNTLLAGLGSRDGLLVIDLATTRTASHNLGPEMEARIRALVQPELPKS